MYLCVQGWYKGELWFFNNYVIPLAQKLDECGVFGVASDEGLFHARENMRQWETEGESIVEEMIQRYTANLEVKMGAIQEDEEEHTI